jgi:hypothetical protein
MIGYCKVLNYGLNKCLLLTVKNPYFLGISKRFAGTWNLGALMLNVCGD